MIIIRGEDLWQKAGYDGASLQVVVMVENTATGHVDLYAMIHTEA